MASSPKISRIACIVAFAMAGAAIVSAVAGPVILLPAALIPSCAGIGILRRRVWGAYGYALFLFSQVAILPLVLLRGRFGSDLPALITAAVLQTLAGLLFLWAGRSLEASGAVRGWALPWIVLTAIMTVLLVFLEPFIIPTGSMENTLLIGDHVMFQRFPRVNPVRGDVVAFIYPVDRKQTFVKRIVGVGGDHIRISGKVLYRNGMAVPEPYAVHKTDYTDAYRDNFPSESNSPLFAQGQAMLSNNVVSGEVVVPAGKYFVLGDNRDQSLDSRYWGFVDAGDILGKPVFVYYSADSGDQVTGGVQFAWQRHVRWGRTFKFL